MKVLCVGPDRKFITGQSVAFNYFIENTNLDIDIIFNSSSHKSVSFFIKFLINVFIFRCKKTVDVLYFTSSRSNLGFVRDFFLIAILKYKNPTLRVVNHLHGADFLDFRRRCVFRFLLDWIYKKIDVSIVLSESMVEQYAAYPDMKISVIPNFSSELLLDRQVEKKVHNFSSSKIVKVLYMSNLMRSKGIVELVDALSQLNSDKYMFHLDIAGKVIDVKSDLFEREFVTYHGVLTGKEKLNLLEEAHVIALPTYYPTEAQPICLIEGMAFGCIVLTSNHNYIPDFVSEKNGYIVPPKDFQNLLTPLKNIFDNRGVHFEVMSKNVEYVKSCFSAKNHVQSIDLIMESICE